ncbi:MFS transporter [Rhodopila sp.]|uniref:MFS transporter n=1 Tax=Rhodopila sp. TaxID=2480087 RepID=UPI002C853391|nr:MFS transporter [Rhodopila sp.]HVZ09019.1 MFS transporter [Rhodopila sp.]
MAGAWPSVLACFMTAVFGWGFGFTGLSVYLANLHSLHGWPTSLISAAITLYYLAGAVCLTQVHAVIRRTGPSRMLAGGVILLGGGASWFGRGLAPWEMFAAALVMAAGWACCTSTAIATSLALYFQQQRGLAITLALNGASVAGFTVAPALAALSLEVGLRTAVPLAAAMALAIVLPLIGTAFPARTRLVATAAAPGEADGAVATGALLRSWRFWSIALPFALALAAQVGTIVHLVSMLLPALGPGGGAFALALTSVAAMTGRLVLAGVIDRLPQRPAAAVSVISQAAGLALVLVFLDQPVLLYAGCVLFGLSVGNVITFPALIIQREFPIAAFSRIIGLSAACGQFTFAVSPALLGLIHDSAGSYVPVLALCIGLQLVAALLVVRRPHTGV